MNDFIVGLIVKNSAFLSSFGTKIRRFVFFIQTHVTTFLSTTTKGVHRRGS